MTTEDNVVPLLRDADDDQRRVIHRAITLAGKRLVRAHKGEFAKYLADELRRVGITPPGGDAA